MTPRKFLAFAVFVCLAVAAPIKAQTNDATNRLAHDIFRQLIEINTTDSVGNTTVAAEAMAKRLARCGLSR